jgi:hypothetical protein
MPYAEYLHHPRIFGLRTTVKQFATPPKLPEIYGIKVIDQLLNFGIIHISSYGEQ